MTRLYGINEWHEDLKLILKRAVATLDQHVVFLFNDSEVNIYFKVYYVLKKFRIKCICTD